MIVYLGEEIVQSNQVEVVGDVSPSESYMRIFFKENLRAVEDLCLMRAILA